MNGASEIHPIDAGCNPALTAEAKLIANAEIVRAKRTLCQTFVDLLVPSGLIVPVQMHIRHGEHGWLKRHGVALILDVVFTVIGGFYIGKQFDIAWMVDGPDTAAVEISEIRLRAILESIRAISPYDDSPRAYAARRVTSHGVFDGARFLARLDIEGGKNVIDFVITPDRRNYRRVKQSNRET